VPQQTPAGPSQVTVRARHRRAQPAAHIQLKSAEPAHAEKLEPPVMELAADSTQEQIRTAFTAARKAVAETSTQPTAVM
jgi:hypothetical protein